MNPELERWIAEIVGSELDDTEAADTFSKRLARENGWPEFHAARVSQEYKRFLALAVTSGELMSPSDAVDQAWHLHLQYSARYREFCRTVLKRDLDHCPSKGGAAEQARYEAAYARTLKRYAEVFGEPPPSDIWPAPSERFASEPALRVTRREHWVLRKPRIVQIVAARLPASLRGGRAALLMVVMGALLATSLSTSVSGPAYLYGYFALWVTCLGAAVVARRTTPRDEPAELPTLSAYEWLQLASGPLGAVDGAVARLIAERAVEFDESSRQLRVTGRLPASAVELERRVYEELRESAVPSVGALRSKARELTEPAGRRLAQLGLVAENRLDLAFWLTLLAPLVGLARVLSRLGTDRPIGLLLLLSLLGLAVALWTSRHRGRTALGEAVLVRARADERRQDASNAPTSEQIPLALALFGTAGVTLPITAGWLGWVGNRPYSASISAGSCGSACAGASCGSDGGGGCGGGCGGCGGGCGGE